MFLLNTKYSEKVLPKLISNINVKENSKYYNMELKIFLEQKWNNFIKISTTTFEFSIFKYQKICRFFIVKNFCRMIYDS